MDEEKTVSVGNQSQTSSVASSGISFSAYRLDSAPVSNVSTHDKQVTLGGVKKPRFKPKSKSTTPTTDTSIVLNNNISSSLSQNSKIKSENTQTISIKHDLQDKNRTNQSFSKRNDFKFNKNNKDMKSFENRPRQGLISSGASFFATGSLRRERNHMNDAEGARRAILLEQGITDIPRPQEVNSLIEEEEDTDEDHYLTEDNNGPMRVPYVYSPITWKEMDEFSPPPTAELLEEVVENELMLFSFPSYLPIYKNYPEYLQGFPNEPKGIRKAEPFDFVHNNLVGIEEGKMGKMRVHQSGRVTIEIDNVMYEMGVGIPMKYTEDAVYVDETTKKMDMLGHLSQRIIISPSLSVYDTQ